MPDRTGNNQIEAGEHEQHFEHHREHAAGVNEQPHAEHRGSAAQQDASRPLGGAR